VTNESPKADPDSIRQRIKEFREKLDKPAKPLFEASEVNERVKRRVKKVLDGTEA